jgi:hypothetical protein
MNTTLGQLTSAEDPVAGNQNPDTVDYDQIVVIHHGTARLAFPAREVMSIQPKEAFALGGSLPLSIGSVDVAGRNLPVFGWSSNFSLLTEPPVENFSCIYLSPDNGKVGIAFIGDKIKYLHVSQNTLLNVPNYAQTPNCPITHWVTTARDVVALTTTTLMANYIMGLAKGRSSQILANQGASESHNTGKRGFGGYCGENQDRNLKSNTGNSA